MDRLQKVKLQNAHCKENTHSNIYICIYNEVILYIINVIRTNPNSISNIIYLKRHIIYMKLSIIKLYNSWKVFGFRES